MKGRSLLLGLALLAAIGAALFFLQKKAPVDVINETQTPFPKESEVLWEDRFRLQLPDDANKIELKNSKSEALGIAVKEEKEGKFALEVLANLPEGEDYFVWIEKSGSESLLLGKMEFVKGGYVFSKEGVEAMKDYKTVKVGTRLESGKIKETILQGSF